MVKRKANFVELNHYNRPNKRYGHYQVTIFWVIHHWKTSWAAANHQQAHLQASRSTAKVGITWQILRLWWDTFGLKIIEQIEWHGLNIPSFAWVLIVPIHNYHYENLRPKLLFWEDLSNTKRLEAETVTAPFRIFGLMDLSWSKWCEKSVLNPPT